VTSAEHFSIIFSQKIEDFPANSLLKHSRMALLRGQKSIFYYNSCFLEHSQYSSPHSSNPPLKSWGLKL
jgi:hypothetical protein